MACQQGLYLWKMFWLLVLPFLSSCEPQAEEATGGLKVQITQQGLEYGKEVGMEMAVSLLKKSSIADISVSSTVPLLGAVTVSLSRTQVKHLQVEDCRVGFVEGTGLELDVQNAQIVFSSDWEAASFFGRENGSVELSVNLLSLWVVLGLDVDAGGRPLVQFNSCHSHIGDFDLLGKSSWFQRFMGFILKTTLISELNRQMCLGLEKGTNQLAQMLKTVNVWAKIDPIAGIDYSLVGKPEVGKDRCNLNLKGEFFQVGTSYRSSLLPAPFFLSNNSSSMIVLGISDFLANSAAFVYFAGKALQVNYTDRMIPKNIPFRLNTKTVGLFLPELKELFPNTAMEIHLAAQSPPALSFHPEGLEATVLGRAEAFVVLPNNSLASAFILNIESNFTGHLFLEAVTPGNSIAKVGGSVALNNFRLSQEWSRVGEIKMPFLRTILKMAGQLALSRVNRRLKEGMLLPSIKGARFLNPKVSMQEGYMLIQTDLHYPLRNPAV